MPYTPDELRHKIYQNNMQSLHQLANIIDNIMLAWDGEKDINISTQVMGYPNALVMEAIKKEYSEWDIKLVQDGRDGDYYTFKPKVKSGKKFEGSYEPKGPRET